MVSPQRGTAGAAGNGAAVSSVTRTGACGTGRNGSQSGPRRRPRGRGPGRSGELKAQWAQSRGTPGEKQERVPRDACGQEECGKGCRDEDKKDQYEANDRLETSRVRGGVDGGEEPRCTKNTTHVGRANSGSGERW